jgi:hypothetical protein
MQVPSSKSRTPRLIADLETSAIQTLDPHRTYTDTELLAQLVACSKRLGMSPTVEQFNADTECHAHSQTIIARFGSWNTAKRKAGLAVHRFATDEELLEPLRDLASKLGRTPTAAEIESERPLTASRSTYAAHFGSLPLALKAAGLDVAIGVDEQLDAAIKAGVRLALETGRVPGMTEWARMRDEGEPLPSEWQIYRLCRNERVRPWQAFQALVEHELESPSAS